MTGIQSSRRVSSQHLITRKCLCKRWPRLIIERAWLASLSALRPSSFWNKANTMNSFSGTAQASPNLSIFNQAWTIPKRFRNSCKQTMLSTSRTSLHKLTRQPMSSNSRLSFMTTQQLIFSRRIWPNISRTTLPICMLTSSLSILMSRIWSAAHNTLLSKMVLLQQLGMLIILLEVIALPVVATMRANWKS